MILRNNQAVYILNINDYGARLMFAIKNVFQYRTNHWTDKSEYEERVRLIYLEFFVQVIKCLNSSKSESDFYLELLQLPDYNSPVFSTIYQYDDPSGQKITNDLIRELGVFLFREIIEKISFNNWNSYEYVVEQAAYTYIVISTFKSEG